MIYRVTFFFILVAAVFLLRCNNNPQEHTPDPLLLETQADDEIPLGDSLEIEITIKGDEERELNYCRMREPSWTIDTISESSFTISWHLPDTGEKRIIIWAFDSQGNESNRDTLLINVTYKLPTLSIAGDSVTSVYTTCTVYIDGDDNDGEIASYEWSLDRSSFRTLEGDADSLLIRWTSSDTGTQLFTMTATDDDGLISSPESLLINVRPSGPEVVITGDSSIPINDTAVFTCTTENETADKEITSYQWSIDENGSFWQTTTSDTFQQTWSLSDTGVQVVRVRAEFTNGLFSPPESLTVIVSPCFPGVEISGTRQVIANDTTTFTAHAFDTNGTIDNYSWTVETSDGDSTIITGDSLITFSWPDTMAGKRVSVRVTVTDDDALVSSESALTVLVKSGKLMFVPYADTTLSSTETLLVKRSLIDTNESASHYYWDTDDSEGWDTVTTEPQLHINYAGVSPVTIVSGVGDSAASLFQDSFMVAFNRPPEILPKTFIGNDTVWLPCGNIPGSLTFDYSITDPDNNAWEAFIIWKKNDTIDTVTLATLASLPVSDTGIYDWEIYSCDTNGNCSRINGSTCIGREYTVCFAGHSIVVGYGDTTCEDGNGNTITCPTTAGGFRPGVLSALRGEISFNERIRTVGPLTTISFLDPVDDSCFAFNGAYARELLLLMEQAYVTLSADIWVIMLGVNAGFSGTEISSTISVIRNALIRNPVAKVYVLTAPIHSSATVANYRNYNNSIRESVASINTEGSATFIVEADTLLCDGYDVYDSLYCSDLLHPNHDGYQLLKDEIVEMMFNSSPPVLVFKEE